MGMLWCIQLFTVFKFNVLLRDFLNGYAVVLCFILYVPVNTFSVRLGRVKLG